jgi:hypothetical protein
MHVFVLVVFRNDASTHSHILIRNHRGVDTFYDMKEYGINPSGFDTILLELIFCRTNMYMFGM